MNKFNIVAGVALVALVLVGYFAFFQRGGSSASFSPSVRVEMAQPSWGGQQREPQYAPRGQIACAVGTQRRGVVYANGGSTRAEAQVTQSSNGSKRWTVIFTSNERVASNGSHLFHERDHREGWFVPERGC